MSFKKKYIFLFFISFAQVKAETNYILKPEKLETLSKKLNHKNKETTIEEYLLFSERIRAGFANKEWLDECKKNRSPALCIVIEDYFEFTKRQNIKSPAVRRGGAAGAIRLNKIKQLQAASFQSLIRALPSTNTSLLLKFAKEAIKNSACPQNLSIALAYDLDHLAHNTQHRKTIETLYENALKCAKPDEDWFELMNMRYGLIKLALSKQNEAIPYFKKALEAEFPREDYRNLYWLAKILLKSNPSEGEKYFNLLLESYPRSWYAIQLLHQKGQDPLKMNIRKNIAPDIYSTKDALLDTKFTWLKLSLLLETDPYDLKNYAEYVADQVTPNLEFGYVQHLARLLNTAKLHKAKIRIVNRYLTLSNPPVTEEFLRYLYPSPFLDIFNAHGAALDTAIIIGLARQESSFDIRAKSSADARGLLQLLPSTAKALGSKKESRLWSPTENVRFASKFLLQLAARFDNSIEKSLAAYNAGPNKVERWRKDLHWVKDPEIFVDLIPYRETRDYVPSILRNAYWYHRLYPGQLNVDKKEFITSGLLKPLIR